MVLFATRCASRWLAVVACVFGNLAAAQDAIPRDMPTMSYEQPVRLRSGGQSMQLEQHAVTRCFDWEQDGDLDLLVGGGDGRLWLFRNAGQASRKGFQTREPIRAGDRDRWGTSYTGVVLAHLTGNLLPDLAVCHSGDKVTIHPNIGTSAQPRFSEEGLTVQIQKNCQGRFDVADWDGDGLLDLVTGSFGGTLVWYPNVGQANRPRFGAARPLAGLRLAYNAQPRIVDFNQDGRLDVLLGVNWGTVSLYLNANDQHAAAGNPRLHTSRLLHWSDGTTLNIRKLNGDDTTPELADLDGDGVLDLISGGKNGRIFLMRGIGFASRVQRIRSLLERHAGTLGTVLNSDDSVRQQLFGALQALQADLAAGLIPDSAREQLFKSLADLADRYPSVLRRSRFDLKSAAYLPLLAGQFWVVVLESLADSAANRERVADALDFRAGYRRLLVDLGVLLIDNNTATVEHLAAMHRLMTAMPRATWNVETITVAGWLGPAVKSQKIRSKSGINIFDLPLGRTENSFAADAPRPGVTDVYLICLAHELAHNMLDTVGRTSRPDLYERKFAGLAQAAGADVIFHSPKSRGIDFNATKKKFQSIGAWDGDESSWKQAWSDYFKGKAGFDRAYTRGNIHFFLNAPQEAFATLANQYFADSLLMLEFCKVRWDAGHRSNVNQFLLIAEYLSQGAETVPFYVLRPGGDLTTSTARLTRDSRGRIVRLQSGRTIAEFDYQPDSLVSGFRMTSAPQ